jgi:two-component system NtrC family sensor kinase
MPLKRFFADLLGPTGETSDAERPLRWLVAASLLLPAALFIGAATISYRAHVAEAEDRLQRNLGIVYEHALKVFETFEIIQRYLDELLSGTTDAQIHASEAEFNARLKGFTDTMPQLADIWVIDAAGHPVVSGTVFPIPRDMDLSDRDYFRVHKTGEVEGVYVSDIVEARATNARGRPRFFTISRKRVGANGEFAGVTAISVSPEYFADYYANLPQPLVATLIRRDGYVLARYPQLPGNKTARLSQTSPFMGMLRQDRAAGTIQVQSSLDGVEREFAFRKLPRVPVYTAAGIDVPDVRAAWLRTMSRHLIFGVPATLAMFMLTLMALQHTRRGALAHRRLREEVARREETEQRLRQAQKMEAIGRLSGGIAHDFNNLLTAIIGNLDLALRRLDGQDRVRGWLGNCRQAADRAATLVQRMLAFSRQHPLDVKAVDINRLVQGMSELLRRTIGETVTIETVLAGGLWKAAVDPNQLESAILNLAINSRDAMPDGGQLTIETANCHLDERYAQAAGEDVKAGQYVMVAVTDNGTGMSREVMSHAFDPFFTTKPLGVGTGLGLSMVYGFAKQSGGHIGIYSEMGEGTTIKLYFPRLTEQGSIPSWEVREPDTRSPLPGGRETLLVVEDDEQVNRFAVEALEERGYRVVTAPDGPAALTLLDGLSDAKVDLLLTDVILPGGMNGRQLADAVAQRRPGTKVLYITGYTRNAIIHHGRLDPDIELLTKPFTAEALARKLRQILDAG